MAFFKKTTLTASALMVVFESMKDSNSKQLNMKMKKTVREREGRKIYNRITSKMQKKDTQKYWIPQQ